MPDDEPNRKIRSKKPTKGKMIGSWETGRTIGKGSSGHVRIARHTKTGQLAAVKIVSKHALVSSRLSMARAGEEEDKILLAIEREIVIMKLIDHPNVLSLYDVWETKSELYLVMEYVPRGELFDYLVERGRLPTAEAVNYFQQIISAVDYCHRFNIAHRDLKPENLLLDKDRNIKVADFGMAAWEGGDAMLRTSCGSPHYASPEVVAGSAYHGSVSDIWSCGVILYALLAGRLPFDDDNVRVLLDKVRDGRYTMPNDIEPAAKDLLRRMLEKDVNKRITMPEILKHPFCLSRPPRPMKVPAVSPPTLEEVGKPVKSADEIDPDIFENLRILWHGAGDDEIIRGLTSDEKTWEKAVYHLLVKFRLKQLENYNMEEETGSAEPKRRAPSKRVPAPALPEPLRPAVDPQPPTPQSTTPETRPLPTTPVEDDPPELQTRPDAPTPRRSAAPQADVPTSQPPSQRASAIIPSDIPAPQPEQSPTIPIPEITLQGATPARAVPDRRVSAASAQSAGSSIPSPVLAALAPLQAPQVQDAVVQNFLKQVADTLNAMQAVQMRQSMISQAGFSPDLQAALALHLPNGAAAFRSMVPAEAPPPTPLDGVFVFANDGDSRYEDAPEEYDDRGPSRDGRNSAQGYAHSSNRNSVVDHPNPAYGLGIANYPEIQPPRSAPNSRPQSQYRHSAGPYYPAPGGQQRRVSPVGPPAPLRIHVPSSGEASDDNKENGHRVSYTAPQDYRGVRPRANSHHVPRTAAQEEHTAGLKPRSSIRSDGAAPRRTPMGEKHVQIVLPQNEPSWMTNKMTKRRSIYGDESPYMSDSASPNPSAPALHTIFPSVPQAIGTGQRKSWFTNLFNFKPASYSLLSVYDPRITRDECRKLLRSFGVNVLVQNSESASGGLLKCKLDEVKDPAGVMAVVKAVRFRVEFNHTSASHSIAGYITSLTLIQEKGALSSFKLIFNRLRREWELDVPGGLHNNSTTRNRSSYHAGGQTLRLVPTHTGGSASTGGGYAGSGGAPSPALSAGGRFVDPEYLSPVF